jgi:hypothetical protein
MAAERRIGIGKRRSPLVVVAADVGLSAPQRCH